MHVTTMDLWAQKDLSDTEFERLTEERMPMMQEMQRHLLQQEIDGSEEGTEDYRGDGKWAITFGNFWMSGVIGVNVNVCDKQNAQIQEFRNKWAHVINKQPNQLSPTQFHMTLAYQFQQPKDPKEREALIKEYAKLQKTFAKIVARYAKQQQKERKKKKREEEEEKGSTDKACGRFVMARPAVCKFESMAAFVPIEL